MPKEPSQPAASQSPWAAAAVGPVELEAAKREALLQLKIGRVAHLSTVLVSAALALEAILLLFVFPTLPPLARSDSGERAVAHSFYLVLPLAGAVALAAVGLVSKWEAFSLWPWEWHFSTSVGALALTVAAAGLYAARVAGAGPTGHAGLYPDLVVLILAGASAALFGTVATWRPWGARHWTSAVTAVAPVATAALLYLPSSAGDRSEALAVALLISAILYQTSGSFLHLASSGTGAHEETVISARQSRIVRLAADLQHREEAVRFREAALLKREADAESAEASLRRSREALGARQSELDRLAKVDEVRTGELASRERDLAGRTAALRSQSAVLEERRKELDLRKEQLARQAPELAAREQRLARHEGDLARRDVELKHRAQELDRCESAVRDGEGRIASRRTEIEQKTADLLRREGQVTARERATGPGRAEAPGSEAAAREARVQHLKALLDEQNAQLGRRAKEVAEQSEGAEVALRQVAEHRAHLAAREADLAQREEDLQERLKVADERRLQFETAVGDYQQRLDALGRQQVAVAENAADLDRHRQSVADQEKGLAERELRLRSASEELDRREGAVTLRERTVDADEAEVSLRRQEAARMGDLPFAGLLAVAAAERAEGPAISRPDRGRRGRPVPPAPEAVAPTEGDTLAPPTGRRHPDRLPTGTPRLDDLLLGGLPPRSHVVLLGDAFSGKEVALYAFIAEGLKRSEPVLLVTAARSAPEITESLGVVLPQFHEYEQMGLVTWVDASGTATSAGPHRFVAPGSDDRAGLLSLMVQAANQVEAAAADGPFRVGFFGLSAVLAHADERASFAFLQNAVGALKPRNALAMYALEAGALTEAQVESLLGRMDGAIVFRQERDRSFLSVRGFGDVATRDWVEVRATARNLIVGSFALERIR